MELRDYPREFVQRTIELIEKLSAEAEHEGLATTFLLNCTLGMIVATSENIELCDSDFFKKRICELEGEGVFPKKIAYIDFKSDLRNFKDEINKTSLLAHKDESFVVSSNIQINKYKQARNITLAELLKKIRNGVAHQNIMPINRDKVWKGIRIWNHNNYGIKDFEIEFKVAELRRFALFLANKFVGECQRNDP